jgi:hypothetical protein
MFPPSPRVCTRLTGLALLVVLSTPGAVLDARAELLTFGSTQYTQTQASAGLPLEGTLNAAVFRRNPGASSGDPWGTGYAALADAVRSGLGSPADGLDRAAQYLYVYQLVNDGADGQSIGSLGLTIRGATSWGTLAGLGFFDADGATGAGNPLGEKGPAFANAFRPGSTGGVSVGEVPTSVLGSVGLTADAVGTDLDSLRAVWQAGGAVRTDQRSALFYFTSDTGPGTSLFSAQGATSINASTLGTLNRQGSEQGGSGPGNDDTTRAAPEPSTLVLSCVGLCSLGLAAWHKARGRRPNS